MASQWKIVNATGHTFGYYQSRDDARRALEALKRDYQSLEYRIVRVL